jgi:CRP-like cAMP-binding protein
MPIAELSKTDVTRHATRSRKVSRQSDVHGHAGVQNRILLQLPTGTREALLNQADYIELPVGRTLARVGDPIVSVYFPDGGVLSLICQTTTGHQVAVAAVGAEGVVGLGALFDMSHYSNSLVTLVPSRGHLVPAHRFLRVFTDSEEFRRIAMAYIGGRMVELATAAGCNRVHSHRQRLARWLLIATDKAQLRSLPVTHEALAQMVGGPRHAVTIALNQLRTRGAIAYLRGRVDVLKRSALVEEACECYGAPGHVALPPSDR